MTRPPLFSIVTPVYEPASAVLQATIDSVLDQQCPDWEWILVDDASPSPEVREVLRAAARGDSRIRVIERSENGHIVTASNDALRSAGGTFVVFLDHDDLLTPDALEQVAQVIADDGEVDYIYSDEDKVDGSGGFYNRFTKPAWSPERLRGMMYTSHLSVMRRELVERVGGFREGFEGSQDHDLALRVTEQTTRVQHIPHVLYHWRAVEGSAAATADAKPYAVEAGRRAVQDHLDRSGIEGTATSIPGQPGRYRVSRVLSQDRSVSIVIPTRGGSGTVWGEQRCFVVDAVKAALKHTHHGNIEFVVVYDRGTPPPVLTELRAAVAGRPLVLVPFDGPFDFSKKMNVGFLASTGEYIVCLNDDVEALSDRWLEELVAPLGEPDVGMTGAKLLYSDGTLQHVGHAYQGGEYHHPLIRRAASTTGPWAETILSREVSGVTAACAAIRRGVFDEVGGFSEQLPINFNDVDLSYKVRRQGYRIVWVANSELHHFESQSRVAQIESWEHLRMLARWGRPDKDPYWPDALQA